MVRISKQNQRRNQSPRKHKKPSVKTGPKQDNLPNGFRAHSNALENELASNAFIPKIK